MQRRNIKLSRIRYSVVVATLQTGKCLNGICNVVYGKHGIATDTGLRRGKRVKQHRLTTSLAKQVEQLIVTEQPEIIS